MQPERRPEKTFKVSRITPLLPSDLPLYQTRTKDNLEEVEETILRGLISELKMHFVRAPERQKEIEAEIKRQEALKETFTAPETAPSDTLIDDEEE